MVIHCTSLHYPVKNVRTYVTVCTLLCTYVPTYMRHMYVYSRIIGTKHTQRAHVHIAIDVPTSLHSPVLGMVLSGELCDWSCCKDAGVIGLEAFVHNKAPVKHQVGIIDCLEHVQVHTLLVQTETGLTSGTGTYVRIRDLNYVYSTI